MEILRRSPTAYTFAAQEDGKTIIGEVADVTGNLDRINRMRQAEIDSPLLGHVRASIPLVTLSAWCLKLGLSMDEAIANDDILDRFLAEHGKFVVHKGWQ